jgi:hypothetical protein
MQPDPDRVEYEMSHREAAAIRELVASEVVGLVNIIGLLAQYLPQRDKTVISRKLIEQASRLDPLRH